MVTAARVQPHSYSAGIMAFRGVVVSPSGSNSDSGNEAGRQGMHHLEREVWAVLNPQ